jgi:hypothetical protein
MYCLYRIEMNVTVVYVGAYIALTNSISEYVGESGSGA